MELGARQALPAGAQAVPLENRVRARGAEAADRAPGAGQLLRHAGWAMGGPEPGIGEHGGLDGRRRLLRGTGAAWRAGLERIGPIAQVAPAPAVEQGARQAELAAGLRHTVQLLGAPHDKQPVGEYLLLEGQSNDPRLVIG